MEEITARWTEYCSELYSGEIDCSSKVAELSQISPPATDDNNDDILLEEVQSAIKKLKKNKSAGTDGITAEMIRAGGEALTRQIHLLCNQVWKEERFPEEWTQSMIVIIPKKGDLKECTNYRTISLISHMCKVMLMVLLERLKAQMEPNLAEEQAGFRRDRSTIQQILTLRLIAEKAKRKNIKVYNCFIDFKKAFDSIQQSIIWATFGSFAVGEKLIRVLKNSYEQSKSAVRVGAMLGEWFKTSIGTRQGDPLSPTTFIAYLERVMDTVQERGTGVAINGRLINNLRFADDIDLLEVNRDNLQENLEQLRKVGEESGLVINKDKTKSMVFGAEQIGSSLKLGNQDIENVGEFVYLGSLLTWDNDCSKEIKIRRDRAMAAMSSLRII